MVDLSSIFPKLQGALYQITSPATEFYNCVAWAARDVGRWWWPDALKLRYWPAGITRLETVVAFQELFSSLGYVDCQDDGLEPGFEKMAIFANDQAPQHAARQLLNGRWTSKIGELEDIEHDLRDLEGVEYGQVVVIMKRPLSSP